MINVISELRKKICANKLDSFIIPSNDEFQSEYVPDHANRLRFITGFKGSNGVALITSDKAIFFTDGRYILQAKEEVNSEFQIHDIKNIYDNEFLKGKIGYDPKLHTSVNQYKNSTFIACENLVDLIWKNKPTSEISQTFDYPVKYAGELSESKCNNIERYLQDNEIDALVITDPTNICWLLNIRGGDVKYTPVILSYLIFHKDGNYDIYTDFAKFSEQLKLLKDKKVQIDPGSASLWVQDHLNTPILKEDPCSLAKACKNKVEITQARRIHAIDGVAICKLLHWLENKNNTSEIEVVDKLLEFRALGKDFLYPSFATISGFAEHGAIIHYCVSDESSKRLSGNGLFLLDSGGQYFGGTTDITRVVPIGKATYQQKFDFTMVLKGHIALASSIFPEGTGGDALDSIARYHLWKHGKDYAHGTGHGVGNCLSVHEGPQRISKGGGCPLKPGMIVSNEPGYYKNGEYGIRIENLMLVKKLKNKFLGFETLTLAPIERKLILTNLLSKDEKEWLNKYHQKVYSKLSPSLSRQEELWLKKKTKSF
jgi:Xaa-Pro aminopeptidase